MDQKWWIDLNVSSELDGKLEPVGYSKRFNANKAALSVTAKGAENMLELKKKRANEIGMGPCKSLLQTAFMMWMSGSSVNIFSIMVTGMVFMNTLRSLANIQNVFGSLDDGSVNLNHAKLLFVAGNCISIALALYKCGNLGLLPVTSADWTWLLPVKEPEEISTIIFPSLTSQ